MQRRQSPTGWAPTRVSKKAMKEIAHRVGS
jgi:hypothetical protein